MKRSLKCTVFLLLLLFTFLCFSPSVFIKNPPAKLQPHKTPFLPQVFPTENYPKYDEEEGPKKHFVYHALHKTGSEATRTALRLFCKQNSLKCLSYEFCSVEGQGWLVCAKKRGLLVKGRERDIDFGSMTVYRLLDGCCKSINIASIFDGLIEHFPLNVRGNPEFLQKRFHPDSFKFTILRNPLEQFVSYHRMFYEKNYQRLTVPDLNRTIDLFYEFRRNASGLKTEQKILFDILTNSQAKELGWSGDSIGEVLNYLDSLDFVGTFHDLAGSWRMLVRKLNWFPAFFNFKLLEIWPKKRYHLSSHQKMKLAKIQKVDMALYERGHAIFFEHKYKNNIEENVQ